MRHIVAGAFNKPKSTTYNQFKGVDFSVDPMLVSKDRSPYAPNMISDAGGTPQKRPGWRTLLSFTDADAGIEAYPLEDPTINGIYFFNISDVDYCIIHVGRILHSYTISSGVYTWHDSYTLTVNQKSTAVYTNGYLYIFTGEKYLCFWGNAGFGRESGKEPVITIGREATGGGTAYEALNLLTPESWDSFCITNSVFTTPTKTFYSSFTDLDANLGSTGQVAMRFMLAGGSWSTTQLESQLNSEDSNNPYFTVNRSNGSITLSDWMHTYMSSNMAFVAGVDNLLIKVWKTREGDADKINKATVATLYNGFLFCAGVDKGMDYRSGFDDPTYFPADGYDAVGTTATDIMGYLRVGQYLAIVKESNDLDATIYFRYDTTDADGDVIFRREQAVGSLGAVSRNCFATLRSDPLFLSREGVFAIVSNNLTNERLVQNRSGYVDAWMTAETDLSNACAAVWDGWYVLCVNDKAYVLDATQNKSYREETSSYWYEAFHWDNIPAVTLASYDGYLYFGTDDGKFCKFNTDITTAKYTDNEVDPIDASWSTKVDDDGSFAEKKSLIRAGSALVTRPNAESSVEIYVRSDNELAMGAGTPTGEVSFSRIDDLAFTALDTPKVIPFRAGLRRYHVLQITVRNNVLDQGFGITGIIKRYYHSGMIR